jgi:hypothetical protein
MMGERKSGVLLHFVLRYMNELLKPYVAHSCVEIQHFRLFGIKLAHPGSDSKSYYVIFNYEF